MLASPAMSEVARSRAAETLVTLADQCVQCGLCLPTCPTYTLDLVEAESPRGRIALARAWALEIVPPTPTGNTHLDQCLGCRRCEVVCPAGVQYGALLIAARARQRERRAPGWKLRATEILMARPRWLSRLMHVYRWLYPVLPTGLRPVPRPPKRAGPQAATRGNVALFIGCIADSYETGLRSAVSGLCAELGIALYAAAGQTCCGSLHAHAGNTVAAEKLASQNRRGFAGFRHVLTLASGCHEAVANALQGVSTVTDAIDFLAEHGERLRFRECRERIALHLPCTQRNVVKSDAATRTLLARVPGLTVVELDAGPLQTGILQTGQLQRSMGCCGAAGTQMLIDPARAAEFRRPLLDQLAASGATRLLSANIGCRLHFANGTRLPVQHPLEFLAECLL